MSERVDHWRQSFAELSATEYAQAAQIEAMRADALRRVAKGLDLPEDFIVEIAGVPRADTAIGEAHQGAQGSGPTTRPALRSVTPAGHLERSEGDRRRRIALRRNVYRCRTSALLMCVVMAGVFAMDRPVAGVLASALVFMLLRCAAEARAEL